MTDPDYKDFLDFINSSDITPPEKLRIKVLNCIKSDLNKEKANQTVNTKEQFSLSEILKEKLHKKRECIKKIIQDCKKYGVSEPILQFRNVDSLSEEDADLVIKVLSESGIVEELNKAKNKLS